MGTGGNSIQPPSSVFTETARFMRTPVSSGVLPLATDLTDGSCESLANASSILRVAGDARDIALAQPPAPELFYSHLQKQTSGNIMVLIRTNSSRSVPVETIRALIAEFNPTLRMVFHTDVGTLVGTTLRPSETRAKLLGALALLALLLAAGGMYATATFGLGQRAKEFGIRLAMGADAAALAWLVYRHYARLAAIAGLAGAAAASGLSQFVVTGLSLFDANDLDFGVLAAAPAFCVLVVLASVAVPTLRAIRVDPSPLLRADAN
jgi:putative ABC transport system permease protein